MSSRVPVSYHQPTTATVALLTALLHADIETAKLIIGEADHDDLIGDLAHLLHGVIYHSHQAHGCSWTTERLVRRWGLQAAQRAHLEANHTEREAGA